MPWPSGGRGRDGRRRTGRRRPGGAVRRSDPVAGAAAALGHHRRRSRHGTARPPRSRRRPDAARRCGRRAGADRHRGGAASWRGGVPVDEPGRRVVHSGRCPARGVALRRAARRGGPRRVRAGGGDLRPAGGGGRARPRRRGRRRRVARHERGVRRDRRVVAHRTRCTVPTPTPRPPVRPAGWSTSTAPCSHAPTSSSPTPRCSLPCRRAAPTYRSCSRPSASPARGGQAITSGASTTRPSTRAAVR